ncbi:uncharacterized protein LOC116181125 isoform X2 [Photinus pyralis]|uniref:uncharacterized protein LOC116181125 isoform X2 n=1 Tax=Photinus pyralis TaxID=7054 RepID=UPI0012670A04|nr:uncharacterized protein LOC116181125 isoform X2 [Photinus pyralis]
MAESEINCKLFGIPTLIELNKAAEILRASPKCTSTQKCISTLKFARYHILNCINNIKANERSTGTITSTDDLRRDIFLAEMEAEYEHIKIGHIRNEWLQHQHTLAELQECYFRKRRLLSIHGTYCSAQGATFCSLIAVVLHQADAMQSFINDNDKLIGFARIAEEFLNSFSITYSIEPPLEDSPDYKFAMGVYTCLAMVAGDVAGRIFLIAEKRCRDCVWGTVHHLARVRHESMRRLKMLVWTFFHNLTADPDGILLLQGCPTMLARINDCLEGDYDGELCKRALEILERLSGAIPNVRYLRDIESNIDMRQLKKLSDPFYKGVHLLPRRIFRNIGRAASDFLHNNAYGDVKNALSNPLQCRCNLSAEIQSEPSKRSPPHRPIVLQSDGDTSSSTVSKVTIDKETQVRSLPKSYKHKKCSKRHDKRNRPKQTKAKVCPSPSNEEKQIRSINLNDSKGSFAPDGAGCTCPVKSERQIVPWTPERKMISYLAESDRRIPAARIINRVTNTQTGNKRQRVISRIKISGLSFK